MTTTNTQVATADPESLNELKKITQRVIKDNSILKAKIEKSRATLQMRSKLVQKVYTQPKKEQKLETATQNGVDQLKRTIVKLNHTEEALLIELDEITKSYRFDRYNELMVDLELWSAEKVRISEDKALQEKNSREFRKNLESLKKEIEKVDELRSHRNIYLGACDDLKSRLDAFVAGKNRHEIEHEFDELKKACEDLRNQLYEARSKFRDDVKKGREEYDELLKIYQDLKAKVIEHHSQPPPQES